jgi:hypothetical protein
VGPGQARFLIASNDPISVDHVGALARFRTPAQHLPLSAEQRASLERFLEHATLTHVRRGEPLRGTTPPSELNHDLHPRDEYFLNDG